MAGIKVLLHEENDDSPLHVKVEVPGASRIMAPESSLHRIFGSELLYENLRFFLQSTAVRKVSTNRDYSVCLGYEQRTLEHHFSIDEAPFPLHSRWSGTEADSAIDVHYCGFASGHGSMPLCIAAADDTDGLTIMRLEESPSREETKPTGVLCQLIVLKVDPIAVLQVFTDPAFHEKVIGISSRIASENERLLSIDDGNIEFVAFDSSHSSLSGKWSLKHPEWAESARSVLSLSVRSEGDVTLVRLLQSGIPDRLIPEIKSGWTNFYWSKLGFVKMLNETVDQEKHG